MVVADKQRIPSVGIYKFSVSWYLQVYGQGHLWGIHLNSTLQIFYFAFSEQYTFVSVTSP